MKKYKVIGIFVFLLVLLFPFQVYASSEPTKDFYSYITVREDGSIKVQEIICLSGDYNGLLRDIAYRNITAPSFQGQVSDLEGSDIYNGSRMTNLKIGSIASQSVSFDSIHQVNQYFEQVSTASNGRSGVYTMYETGEGINLKVFNPSSLKQAFYIEYVIDDVVVVHNDIAEIAWNVLGDGYQENIGNFQVKVVLPQKDSDLRTWLRGPLNGKIKRLENGAEATYDFLGAYNAVSIRLIFDKNMVPQATKYSYLDAKEAIIEIETKQAEIANQERAAIRRQNNFVIVLTLLWLAGVIILTIVIFKKAKQSKKTDFDMQYYRDFPGEYGPEVLQYLLDKHINEKSLSATILNLIYKKVLIVEPVGEKKKDYKLVLQEDHQVNLTETEDLTIQLFIQTVGNGKEVNLSSFKKYCSSVSHAEDFMEQYNRFLKKAKNSGKQEEFYASYPSIFPIAIIIALLGIVISVISIGLEVGFIISYLAGLIGIILCIMIATRRFYTPKGAQHLVKWMAHKQFLKDFSRFDEKELPEVILWDKYLVYATILGCADELSKQMEVKINTMDNNTVVVEGYDPILHHYLFHSAIYSSVNQSVHTAVSSSRASIAASQSSSGGGFGGGASGGGGSFGGGGGGGRF